MSRFSRPLNRHNRRRLRQGARPSARRAWIWTALGVALVVIVLVARARLQLGF